MDPKMLLSKVDVAALIVLCTAILYIWKFMYWASYYYYFGLPISFGSIGFERLLLAGSWFLGFFVSRGVFMFLSALILFVALRWLFRKFLAQYASVFLNTIWQRVLPYGGWLRTKWILYASALIVISLSYHLLNRYIEVDAARDAEERINTAETLVTLVLKNTQTNTAFASAKLDLLEHRGDMY